MESHVELRQGTGPSSRHNSATSTLWLIAPTPLIGLRAASGFLIKLPEAVDGSYSLADPVEIVPGKAAIHPRPEHTCRLVPMAKHKDWQCQSSSISEEE